MKISFYTPVYALTLLLSAGLLFSIQPMFSKMILPLLGGTPQVWNTAMLFFQLMLLGGYAYAHGTSKILSVKAQAVLHIVLLTIFLFVLPLAIPEGWAPPTDKSPALWQLSLMIMTVGGPFFVLSASAPMFQHWFADTDHPDADNPYFLYGASNLGSITALLAYPVLIEPFLTIPVQSQVWAAGYCLLIIFTALCAFLVWNAHQKKSLHDTPPIPKAKETHITWKRRFLWVMLAFIPSSLMLGVTTFITTDVASVPLLWIVPLALYVGTFIIVFARKPLISLERSRMIQGMLLILLTFMLMSSYDILNDNVIIVAGFHIILFFFCALTCHMELAAARPGTSHLTEFYMFMSIGGALGGFFNAIIAPTFFVIPLEYMIALMAALFFRYATHPDFTFKQTIGNFKIRLKEKGLDIIFTPEVILSLLVFLCAAFSYTKNSDTLHNISGILIVMSLALLIKNRWIFAILISLVMLFFPPGYNWGNHDFKEVIHLDRNFFGVIKVADYNNGTRLLMHGTTNHGTQALASEYKLERLSYYADGSPLDLAFSIMDERQGPQNIAVLGLGIGVAACFQKEERHFDFYEIDANVIDVAENSELFTFLSDCGSSYDIILGDGRLKIQDKPDHSYDVIVLDAFSSDNVPIHILTVEAIEIYLQKLKSDGMLIFNVSNNYLDLEPVLTNAAKALDIKSYGYASLGGKKKDSGLPYYPAHFVALSKDLNLVESLKDKGWSPTFTRKGVGTWTDNYSNILSVFSTRSADIRLSEQMKKRIFAKEAAKAKAKKQP